jgi:hypothetical protein
MSEMPPTPAGTPRYTSTRRRLLTVSAGLGIAVLAGVTFVVTYGDVRALVVAGHAPRRFAPAYPVMFDALITVTILALVVARNGRWWIRWPRWLLLLVLLSGAAAASVQRATRGYAALPDEALKAGTAVAPHVMLLLAIWLWLAMFKQARRALARRPAATAEASPGDDDGSPPEAEERADVPGFAPARSSAPESGQQAGEPGDHHIRAPAEDTTWRDPWVPEEPPVEAALDWALVPYDPEPAPYEPDPAIQPYEPDPMRSYEPDPIPEAVVITEPVAVPEPTVTPEPTVIPEPRAIPDPITFDKPVPQTSLPTDIKLVGRPAATTQPDLVVPGAAEPDAEGARPESDPRTDTETPVSEPSTEPATARTRDSSGDEDGADVPVVDRAEDPDAGDDHLGHGRTADDPGQGAPQSTTEEVERWSAEAAEDARRWAEEAADGLGTGRPGLEPERTTEVEWKPPSSTFRSSPTPPDE